MANSIHSFIKEADFGFHLTGRLDLFPDKFCNVTGLVHGIERKAENSILFSLLLSEGYGCSVEVDDDKWDRWREVVKVGKVITLNGIIPFDKGEVSALKFVNCESDTIFTLIHNTILTPRTPSCFRMIVVKWEGIYSQPNPHFPNCNIMGVCQTGDGKKMWILFSNTFTSTHHRVLSFVKGAAIHIGPLFIDKTNSGPLGFPPTDGVEYLIGSTNAKTVIYENI